jgi:hypothetical protein
MGTVRPATGPDAVAKNLHYRLRRFRQTASKRGSRRKPDLALNSACSMDTERPFPSCFFCLLRFV